MGPLADRCHARAWRDDAEASPRARGRAAGQLLFPPTRRRLAAGEIFQSSIVWASQVRNERAERLWHVTIKSRSSLDQACTDPADLGEELEQLCFATMPTHLKLNKSPTPIAILHLRDRFWSTGLSKNWSELDVSVSSSRQFNQECGVKYGGYLRRDIRACLNREEVLHCPSTPGKQEIVKELTTVGGLRASVEFVFEVEKRAAPGSERPWQRRRGDSGEAASAQEEAASSWVLADIVVMVKGPETGES